MAADSASSLAGSGGHPSGNEKGASLIRRDNPEAHARRLLRQLANLGYHPTVEGLAA
jgi:hypothetical protein